MSESDDIKDAIAPNHYQRGAIEVWDAIIGLQLGYFEGNILKYISRYKFKGTPTTDLYKAQTYLNKLIEQIETKEKESHE